MPQAGGHPLSRPPLVVDMDVLKMCNSQHSVTPGLLTERDSGCRNEPREAAEEISTTDVHEMLSQNLGVCLVHEEPVNHLALVIDLRADECVSVDFEEK